MDELMTLSDRSTDMRRMQHAARAMAVLENDLRGLLNHRRRHPIPDDAARYAIDTYRLLRTELLEVLDESARLDACTDLGVPEIDEDASLERLLLAISQATRYLGTEEGWPEARIAYAAQKRRITEQRAAIERGEEAGSATLQIGPGYI